MGGPICEGCPHLVDGGGYTFGGDPVVLPKLLDMLARDGTAFAQI